MGEGSQGVMFYQDCALGMPLQGQRDHITDPWDTHSRLRNGGKHPFPELSPAWPLWHWAPREEHLISLSSLFGGEASGFTLPPFPKPEGNQGAVRKGAWMLSGSGGWENKLHYTFSASPMGRQAIPGRGQGVVFLLLASPGQSSLFNANVPKQGPDL